MSSILEDKFKITVVPTEIVVFSNFEDTEELLLKIENNAEEKEAFDLTIILPDDIEYECRDDIGYGEFKRIGWIEPNRQKMFLIRFRYLGKEKREEMLNIFNNHSVKLHLDPS